MQLPMRNPFKRAVHIENHVTYVLPVRAREGDVLFITSERRVPRDVHNKLRLQLQERLPGNKVVLLEAGLKLLGSVEAHDVTIENV